MTPALCPCGAPVDKAVNADLCPRCYWTTERDDNDRIDQEARAQAAAYQEQAHAAYRRANRAVLELARLDGHAVVFASEIAAATEARA